MSEHNHDGHDHGQGTIAAEPLRIDGALAIATEEYTQLRDLAIRALTELLGSAPETDEDGDIDRSAFVITRSRAAMVALFALLASILGWTDLLGTPPARFP